MNKVGRILWSLIWLFLYRPSPRIVHGWRRMLLRLFGAKIGSDAHPYPSARIWAPWNLEMGDHSCLGDHTDCYSVDKITIGPRSTVSQYSFLCTASHDYQDPALPLITAPIAIGEHAWIAADVFVGPGVTIGEGAVVGTRSSVFRNVESWTVVAGNPTRVIKKRDAWTKP
jgi:putative colanic acid biosynthesis acetyltransferase WcaF